MRLAAPLVHLKPRLLHLLELGAHLPELAAGFLRKMQEGRPQASSGETAPAPTRERAGMRLEAQVTIDGRQVKVAVWGSDDADVQARLQAVLQQHPAQTPASPQGQPSQGDTPQCEAHGPMKPSRKGTGWYCPHKLPDGETWCPSKGPRHG